ncbi:RNA-directed DNA polymerase, eukaryota, reverse transcriptase zinc-binding domain protein [Tanacetum coccineum]
MERRLTDPRLPRLIPISVYNPYAIVSDHSPMMINFPKSFDKKKKPFRFANYIVDKEDFLTTVQNGWNNEVQGSKMFRLVKKMKGLKRDLNALSWKNGNMYDFVDKCRKSLKEGQGDLDKRPHNHEAKKRETEALLKYNEAIKDEENLLFQKAKVEWISEGDKNNQYFHKVIKSRSQAKRICSICDDQGNRLEGNQMEEQFVKHFNQFLGANKGVNGEKDFERVFGTKLSKKEAMNMVNEVTDNEIKHAMFDIGDNKALGPDGYTSTFFKKAWKIVGDDVCLVVKEFFGSGKLLGELNATLVSLVPKISTPKKVSDYRPIACCNVVYKCISKIITERIKPGLHKLVDLNQSCDRKTGSSRCCLKIDIAKAYDTIDWKFLEKCLKHFGFHERMVHWIMVCVTTSKLSININGERKGYFASGRGLRQGDRLSPCLFTLVMEIFTLIIRKNVYLNPKFKFHKGCKDIRLTNLCFADDLLVVCHGSVDSVSTVKESLMEFSEISRLNPNMDKSTIFFGSVNEETKRGILNILPFVVGKLPMKYLGVPLITKRLGSNECKQLVDKVRGRIDNWKNKYLSYAGRLQLIASVLSSLNVYWAGVFLIPKTVIKEIDKVLKGFLWCKGEIKRGMAKVDRKTVCSPKSQGGLGLRLFGKWNEVLLIKNLWICVKWVNVIKLKGKSIWDIQAEYNDSWMWKTLLDLMVKVRRNIFKVLGNGRDTNFWFEQWCTDGIIGEIVSRNDRNNARLADNMSVWEMIDDKRWRWPESWKQKYPILANIRVPKLNNQRKDETKWKDNKVNLIDYSSKAAWEAINSQSVEVNWNKDRIMAWSSDQHMKCPLCKVINDSHNHLFFECEYSSEIWDQLKKKMDNKWLANSWDVVVDQCANKERNAWIFKNELTDKKTTMKMIIENIRLQLMGLKVKRSPKVQEVAMEWEVQMNYKYFSRLGGIEMNLIGPPNALPRRMVGFKEGSVFLG